MNKSRSASRFLGTVRDLPRYRWPKQHHRQLNMYVNSLFRAHNRSKPMLGLSNPEDVSVVSQSDTAHKRWLKTRFNVAPIARPPGIFSRLLDRLILQRSWGNWRCCRLWGPIVRWYCIWFHLHFEPIVCVQHEILWTKTINQNIWGA
jgi:hypothetical protein